jgi:hypothetical protein
MNPTKIHFIQINAQHNKITTSIINQELHYLDSQNKNSIILIQEPYTYNKSLPGLPRHRLIFDSNSEKPRTGILFSSRLKLTPIQSLVRKDLAASLLSTNHPNMENICIASLYLDITDNLPGHNLTDLIKTCKNNKWHLICSVDTNAHSPLWNSKDSNQRGQVLEDFIILNNLIVLNRGNKPTFVTRRCSSIIDVLCVHQK